MPNDIYFILYIIIIIINKNSFLDRKDSTSLEYKLDTFSAVYKRLTGKEVNFEFPVSQE